MKVTLRDMRELKDGTTTAVLIIPPESEDDFYVVRKAAKHGKGLELMISEDVKTDLDSPIEKMMERIRPLLTDFWESMQDNSKKPKSNDFALPLKTKEEV